MIFDDLSIRGIIKLCLIVMYILEQWIHGIVNTKNKTREFKKAFKCLSTWFKKKLFKQFGDYMSKK